jgi:hypothetical protein
MRLATSGAKLTEISAGWQTRTSRPQKNPTPGRHSDPSLAQCHSPGHQPDPLGGHADAVKCPAKPCRRARFGTPQELLSSGSTSGMYTSLEDDSLGTGGTGSLTRPGTGRRTPGPQGRLDVVCAGDEDGPSASGSRRRRLRPPVDDVTDG